MERRQYSNPPIQEAVCEVRFAPGPNADFSAPGRFYEKIRQFYDGQPRHQQVVATEVQVAADPASRRLSMQQGVTKILFPTADGRRIVGLSQNLLSIHELRPYSVWESFRQRIESGLRAYEEVDKPAGIRQIALRYINRIAIRSPKVHLGEYLTVAPHLPDSIPVTIAGFLWRLETVYNDRPMRLLLTAASAPSTGPDEVAFLLDIEVRSEWTEPMLPVSAAPGQVDELHQRAQSAFEAFITDRTREVFHAQ